MATFTFQSTVLAIQALEKILKSDIKIDGLENLEDRPTLFVVNHFTRAETFIIPAVIYQYTRAMTRSLAHSGLFRGKFGEYLKKIGAVSTQAPARNRTIIADLLTGRYNWVIYPEGVMVKTKKTVMGKKHMISHPGRSGPPHSGAAMLALYAEIYQKIYHAARKKNDTKAIEQYLKIFDFSHQDKITSQELIVIPVNITYYPIRPGNNFLKNVIKRFFKDLPPRIEEELEIEGNLLLGKTDIRIHFGQPLYTSNYLGRYFAITQKLLPIIKKKGWINFFIWRQLRRLTHDFMTQVYGSVCINIDHLFCAALTLVRYQYFEGRPFLRALLLSAIEIKTDKEHRVHETLGDDIVRIVCDENYTPLHDIKALAMELKVLDVDDNVWMVNKSKLHKNHFFHRVRVDNTLQVIANEVEPVHGAMRVLKKHIHTSPKTLKAHVTSTIADYDQALYQQEYQASFEAGISKPHNIGTPFFLKATCSIGILLSHGYLAAPEEIRPLAEYLHSYGYSVYGVRLLGHGTHPKQLNHVSWEDWYTAYNRGYAVLRNHCKQIILGGFSAGGLLALLAAARKDPAVIRGVFAINAALKLRNAKSKFVPAINFLNDLLKKLKFDSEMSHIDNDPENPDINYHQNSLHGIEELLKMGDACRKTLSKINIPSLIIQSTEDPVVNPDSAQTIYNTLPIKDKTLRFIESKRHGIVRNEGSEVTFNMVLGFIQRLDKTACPKQLQRLGS